MKFKEESQSKRIRAIYKEFVEEYFELPLEKIEDKQRSEGLVRFYIDKIHNLRSSEIGEDDINRGIVDGSNDLGVDFIIKIIIRCGLYNLNTIANKIRRRV